MGNACVPDAQHPSMDNHLPAGSDDLLLERMALDGYHTTIGELEVREVGDRALTSLAFGEQARRDVGSALQQTFGSGIPEVGLSAIGSNGSRLLGLQRDQIWCMQARSAAAMDAVMTSWFSSVSGLYITDQSDGWSILALSGHPLISVLERLCPLDLDPDRFPVDGVQRSVFEHTGVIMLRTAMDSCELISPRSSVNSLVHAIELAAAHVHNEQSVRSSQ